MASCTKTIGPEPRSPPQFSSVAIRHDLNCGRGPKKDEGIHWWKLPALEGQMKWRTKPIVTVGRKTHAKDTHTHTHIAVSQVAEEKNIYIYNRPSDKATIYIYKTPRLGNLGQLWYGWREKERERGLTVLLEWRVGMKSLIDRSVEKKQCPHMWMYSKCNVVSEWKWLRNNDIPC